MTKNQIRQEFHHKRRLLHASDIQLFSQKITHNLLSNFSIGDFKIVHLFLPIKKNNEPDTHKIISRLKEDYHPEIFLPTSLESGELMHTKLTENTAFKKNKWGIEEPIITPKTLNSETFFNTNKNILVLVPLLAFDLHGNRVGYGKGYYDRFLQSSTIFTTKVGLSLFEPISEITDTNPLDIKLDYCVTPSKIWKF